MKSRAQARYRGKVHEASGVCRESSHNHGMDFDSSSLLASLLVSSIGFVLVVYGKRMARIPQLAVGLVLTVFPYFVAGALWILLLGAAGLALLWLALKNGW
ncbi:MAG TPA: hypothetical protein VI197_09345 [Polyangiaceae bacterium]